MRLPCEAQPAWKRRWSDWLRHEPAKVIWQSPGRRETNTYWSRITAPSVWLRRVVRDSAGPNSTPSGRCWGVTLRSSEMNIWLLETGDALTGFRSSDDLVNNRLQPLTRRLSESPKAIAKKELL